MDTRYLSIDTDGRVKRYLRDRGYALEFISEVGFGGDAVRNHADLYHCRLGLSDDSPVLSAVKESIGTVYPSDCTYNAVCTGRYFIHRLDVTAPELLREAESLGMILIDVPQGYARCSVIPVDRNSIITYDRGIAKACEDEDMDVLLIEPGHIELPGYDTGFIGGTAGRLASEIIFHGDLSGHPDGQRIRAFIEKKHLRCTDFPMFPLRDIGSIV